MDYREGAGFSPLLGTLVQHGPRRDPGSTYSWAGTFLHPGMWMQGIVERQVN